MRRRRRGVKQRRRFGWDRYAVAVIAVLEVVRTLAGLLAELTR